MQEFFESARLAARKEISAPFLPIRYELTPMVVPATSPAPAHQQLIHRFHFLFSAKGISVQEFFSCAIESARLAASKEISAPFLPLRYELASMVAPATSPAPGTSIFSPPSSLSRGLTSAPSSAPLASSPASSPLSSSPLPLSPSSPPDSNPITAPSNAFIISSPPLPLRPLPFAPPPPFRPKASHPRPRPFHRTKSSPAISSPVSSSRLSGAALAGIAVAGVITVAVLVVLAAFTLRKKRRKDCRSDTYPTPATNCQDEYYPARRRQHCSMSSSEVDGQIPLPPPCPRFPPQSSVHGPELRRLPQSRGNTICWFTYKELAAATDNFAVSNVLGGGGFGSVYKGVLSGDQTVAVKQLEVGGGQGEREFGAEVEIISRVHHRHLVSLVGYCISGSRRLLVYEFLPNHTLEYHLHVKGTVLSWKKRLKIALGAARGLSYLHEDCHPRIIHRDIKSSNILLDDNFEAKVSDFGLAKLTSDTNTHVTTRVMGTFGYMAPEYASCGKLTEKSDVFSFGVVLLEMVTGRRPIHKSQCSQCLVDWARPLLNQVLESCRVELLADSRLQGRYDEVEMMRMIQAAAVCVHHSADKRPQMSQVVRILEGEMTLFLALMPTSSDNNKSKEKQSAGLHKEHGETSHQNKYSDSQPSPSTREM